MPTDYSYNLVAQNPTSTVVAKYPPEGVSEVREKRAEYYQSEDALEKAYLDSIKTVQKKIEKKAKDENRHD